MRVYDETMEREYDNRAKVPAHPAIMQGWKHDAAALRAAHEHAEIDVAYGGGTREVLDIFWPDAARAAPLAMFIHGGYWQALDKDWFSHLARGFLAHGVALAIPSYALCPQVSLADLTAQVRNAAAFVMRRHGGDLYVTGHSAGGHLTAMLMATDWAARGHAGQVYGGLAISGLFDLEPLVDTSINDGLRLDRAEARRLSPIHQPAPAGRFHALVGAREGAEYTRQSRAIAQAWNGDWQVIRGGWPNSNTGISGISA
jgi:arylformamidase